MTPRKVGRQQSFLPNSSLQRMREKMHISVQGFSTRSMWVCPEDPEGSMVSRNEQRWAMVAHSQSTDPKRSCSVALRLCSLVCQRATVRVKGILVGEAHTPLGSNIAPNAWWAGTFLQNGTLRPGPAMSCYDLRAQCTVSWESEAEDSRAVH